ncbi:MAG: hypothetical protein ABIM19_08595, partial [candidate division WOR-3 bacterium]
MDKLEKIKKGMELLRAGKESELADYLSDLKEDPLVLSLLEVSIATYRAVPHEAIRKGVKLLPMVAGELELARFLFNQLGWAYRMMGEMDTAENYFLRAYEISEEIGDRHSADVARLNLLHNKFFRAEYEPLYRELREFKPLNISLSQQAKYLLGVLEIIRGKPDRSLEIFNSLLDSEGSTLFKLALLEMKGLATRMAGKPDVALRLLLDSAQGYLDSKATYASFPCAKALEISRLTGIELPSRELVDKCVALAEKGSWGEKAAALEITALLNKDTGKAAEGLLEAARSYYRAYQPLEAFLTGLNAAYLSWRANTSTFPEALRFLGPLAPLHPGIKQDPLLGDFLTRLEPFLRYESPEDEPRGIKACLIDGFKVFVDGQKVPISTWRRKRAVRALTYLLLSPKHRISCDHLFYLLWPNSTYDGRT